MSPLERGKFKSIRKDLIKQATGTVLEIGSGTGINFPYYQNAEKVTAIEPSEHMIERSRRKQTQVPIEILKESAERLPFEDNTFDTILVTLALCTIPDPKRAIQEMKRVCKPDGKILLFEHVKLEHPFLGMVQEKLTPYWKKICDGCCLDRKTVQLVKQNGFQIVEQKEFYKGLFVQMELRKN